jgi:hypothetical protein
MKNMISIIAVSTDAEVFKCNRIFDKNWTKKYPGTAWYPIFSNILAKHDLQVVTADIALSHVLSGFWDPKNIGIIQHLSCFETEKLISMGSLPLVITAMESPLYANLFFNDGKKIAKIFPHRIMYSGLIKHFNLSTGNNHNLRFPSFHKNDFYEIKPWNERGFMVMVTRNIYSQSFSPFFLLNPKDIIKYLFRVAKKILSIKSLHRNAVQKFPNEQLHDKRISAIIFFGKHNLLQLFGFGWNDLSNLPHYYSTKITKLLGNLKPKPCEDKINSISNYKFSICFENSAFEGGVFEKIIDCFVAGVIPLYLGASDIEDIIPSNSYIDVRKFKNWDELLNKLKNITESEACSIIENGKLFLKSDLGQMHSYEEFAKFISNLVISECLV